ncbi:MAG TPA: hypothetical protein VFO25_08065 [Candidatus Eremiobacteraceae bacterium]|nr:hypothetical protein [Candidatus Eremiobacteraceae bacterium]
MSGGGFESNDGSGEVNCDIVADFVLQNPDVSVLRRLKQGDDLRVTLIGSSPVVVSGKDVVGSLLIAEAAALIRCIREGHAYRALITAIDVRKSECHVQIRPR